MSYRIENSKWVNFQAGRCFKMVLAECKIPATTNPVISGLSAGDIMLHIYEISAPAEGVTVPLGTVKSAMKEMNRGFNTSGDFAGSTVGNEQLNDKTGTVTYREDFTYFADNQDSSAMYKDSLKNTTTAGVFNDNCGTRASGEIGSVWKVIGTIGNKKEDGCVTAGGDWQYLFYRDSKYISPQDWDSTLEEPRLVINPDLKALQRTTLTTASEYKTNYAGLENKTIRLTGCVYTNPQWNENGDFNTISFDYNYPCDARIGGDLFVNEVPDAKQSGGYIVGGYISSDKIGTSISINSSSVVTINTPGDIKFNKDLSGTGATATKVVDGTRIGVIDIATGELIGYLSLYNSGTDIKASKYKSGSTAIDHIVSMAYFNFDEEKSQQITEAI